MSIFRVKDSPYFQFDIQWQCHRVRGSTKTKNRAEAKRYEDAELDALKLRLRSNQPALFELTLDEACGKYWQDEGQFKKSAVAIDTYLRDLSRLIGKDKHLSQIDDDTVTNFVRERRGEKTKHGFSGGTKETTKFVSPTTVNLAVKYLRHIMILAAGWKINNRPVAVGKVSWSKHILTEPDPIDQPLTAEQEVRLFNELIDYIKPIVGFSILCGVRLNNAITLDWAQIDMNARTMRFKVKSKRPGGKVLVVPISEAIFSILVQQGPMPTGRVFTRYGQPIKSIRTAFKAAARRAGIPHFRWHDLRHTFGSRIMGAGVDVTILQKLMGHSDIKTTMRYIHYSPAQKLAAMESISLNNPQNFPRVTGTGNDQVIDLKRGKR